MLKKLLTSSFQPISSVVLATDLDGTLLAGPLPARRHLRELFSGNIPYAKLSFLSQDEA